MNVLPYNPQPQGVPLPPNRQWLAIMHDAVALAEAVANTDFVSRSMRGNPPMVLAAILYGDEVGLGPMVALKQIRIIEGVPTVSAEAQRALIKRAGHEFEIEETTTARCVVAGRRRESNKTTRITWTLDDAKRANLVGKANWRTYPRQMLQARATAELARLVFPDIIGGLYAREEFEGMPEGDEPVGAVEEAAAPTTRRRRRAPAPALKPVEEAKPDDEPDDDVGGAGVPAEPKPGGPDPADAAAAAEATPDVDETGIPDELPPPSMPPPAPARMTEAQSRKLFALFGERGITDRDERLAYTIDAIGHDIGSATELTASEASMLIERLAAEIPELVAEALNEALDNEAAQAGDDEA